MNYLEFITDHEKPLFEEGDGFCFVDFFVEKVTDECKEYFEEITEEKLKKNINEKKDEIIEKRRMVLKNLSFLILIHMFNLILTKLIYIFICILYVCELYLFCLSDPVCADNFWTFNIILSGS